MKVAFFSPLNPQKSGISDYTEELLPHLAEQADIDLFVDGFTPANGALQQSFRCFDYRSDTSVLRGLSDYDAVVYHMGNDPRYHTGIYETMRRHPGVVVFHDFAYQFFFFFMAYERRQTRIYLEEIEACHGAAARAEAEAALEEGLKPRHVVQPLSFPLNLRLAQAAEAIIVHSEWSRARFEEIVPSTPVAHINMHALPFDTKKPQSTENGKDSLVQIAAFGHVTPEKGIERILNALAWLKRNGHRFHFTLVGEVSPFFNVDELLRERGLKNEVTIMGYVTLEELKRRCAATDIAINLRENYVGETSASLLRLMAAGVPAIVTDVGWFSELPDDSVIKIDSNEAADALLRAYLERLLIDPHLRAQIGANARRHAVSSHSVTASANAYVSFIKDVVDARMRNRFVHGVARELVVLGVADCDEDLLSGVAKSVATMAPPVQFRTAGNGARPPAHMPKQMEPPDVAAPMLPATPKHNGRLRKLEDIDYKMAAREYPQKLDQARRHYLLTKPFDNLAARPPKYQGDGMDAETHRLFCDFANIARQLALAPGSRILDIGCGSGWLSEYFARLGYEVCGIDISPELIEMAHERLRRVPYPLDAATALSCRFETHDIENAPLGETFDAIVCYDSLHHFEDERAVVRHIARMLDYGGLFFILEGDRPGEGSPGEVELIETMQEFGTLESPFDRDYLLGLLQENGFAVIGDYVSVNGFFHRELVAENQVAIESPPITYLLCKKVAQPGLPVPMRDSRQALGLNARVSLNDLWPESVAAGTRLRVTLTIENTGDALWRVGPTALKGSVMVGMKILNEAGQLVFESHGLPPITRALASGERANIELHLEVPNEPGRYELKIDLVAQHVCWFEQVGSTPLVLPLKVI